VSDGERTTIGEGYKYLRKMQKRYQKAEREGKSQLLDVLPQVAIPTTPGAYEWHYTYDGLGRVKEACDQWTGSACDGNAWTCQYNGVGNLLRLDRWDAATEQVETVRFVYNGANQIACLDGNANEQCGDPEDVAYTYDSYGNLTSDGVNTYTYDDAMRLTSVGDGLTTTTYTYNGDGDRVGQTVNDGGGDVTTTYVLDTATPLTMVLAETTGADPTITYLHGLGLVAQSDGTDTEYFAYDGLGSVRQLAGETGDLLLTQTFDPYGNPYESASTAGGVTKFGFTGEMVDANGLIFLRARYYNPSQGRFFQLDPSRQETNPYQYGLSNPVNYLDPSGLCSYSDTKCLNAVDRIEKNYDVFIYWPGRYVDITSIPPGAMPGLIGNLITSFSTTCKTNQLSDKVSGAYPALDEWESVTTQAGQHR
jgi:RHS repeat-associated protein